MKQRPSKQERRMDLLLTILTEDEAAKEALEIAQEVLEKFRMEV